MATRMERDTLGEVEVPAERLWGAQTQRALGNFAAGGRGDLMPVNLLRALVLVKRCAAEVNAQLGKVAEPKAKAIVAAADELLSNPALLESEFPLSVWQSGSGTQTNMNANEVLANRASEILGGERGTGRKIHPNDDVNCGQSTNDVFPTALHVAFATAVAERVIPAVEMLRTQLAAKAEQFAAIVKIGRTHLQDATPLTLGQEFGGYAAQLDRAVRSLRHALEGLHELAIGGTAVGTGVNTHPQFGSLVAVALASATKQPFVSAPNKFAALAGHEPVCFAHGALKTVAVALLKIANDLRWLGSGPRCGLGELRLPENEPGSSIMPGKVNPTQCESVVMVTMQVLGNDAAVAVACGMGNFELNVTMPLLARNVLHSCQILADAMVHFTHNCVAGIVANEARITELVNRSLMLVTALNPHIGYDNAAKIARKAHLEGTTLKEAALSLGFVTAGQFEQWVQPSKMI